jgi:hypothetical protein
MSTILHEAAPDGAFLSAVWGADTEGELSGVHYIAEPTGKGWAHHPVKTVAEALDKAQAISTAGHNAYFACAEYKTQGTRKADNVTQARAFWLDLDCGGAKAANGDGYATKREAAEALVEFCKVAGLPNPTALVDSGNGWHVYWVLDTDVSPEEWRAYSRVWKALTKKHGLRADPSRTCDIASVLRVPGTLNLKDPTDAKPVKLKFISKPIEWRVFKAALEAASGDGGEAKPNNTALTGGLTKDYPPMPETPDNVAQVRSMLADIPADCSREVWRDVVWAVQSTGWAVAVELAREWSRTAVDKYDAAEFDKLVASHDPAGGIGFGTLVHHAKLNGWVEPAPSWLDEMNGQYAWIDEDAGIYRLGYRSFITVEKFNTAHANQFIEVRDGDKTKSVSVSRAWITNAKRRQHTKIVLRPGEPEVTSDGALNDWRGYSVQPVRGDVAPWMRLYRRLFGGDQFALHWLAHKVQRPGVKKHTCLVVWSGKQGVGKNLLFEAVGALFNPRHFCVITQSEVDDDFTGWMPGRVFVLADEIKATGRDKTQNRLNIWTTAATLKTHDKGQPKRDIENLMDMVFLSNHADALFLSDADRRFWVHEVTAGALPEDDIRAYIAWRENGGLAHLLQYLMNADLTGFDPKCRAPITDAKREMIEAGRSDLDRWCRDIVTGSVPMGREIVTAEEVATRFSVEYPHAKGVPPAAIVTKVLVKMGAYARPNQVRLGTGRKVRAVAVSRPDYWKDQPESAWRDGMEKWLSWGC